MNRLVIATTATAVPMGAQVYQEFVAGGAAQALAETGPAWQVERLIARSMRSPLPGNARLPMAWVERASHRQRRLAGRLLYPRGAVVHRMELGIPPAADEILTMHDVVAWRFPDEGSPPSSARAELREAAAIVCVSQHTADDVAEMFGVERLHVAHLGVDERFRQPPPLSASELERLGITGPFVLHAGGSTERKNLAGLGQAWDLVQDAIPQVQLVLAGPEHERRNAIFGGLPRTVRTGRLPDEVVPRLLASATAVVVPSLYEGFGLPVLEAMAAGVPVVAARTSSLPEVAGGAALLVEPTGPAIAEGLRYVVGADFDRDGAIRAGLARAGEFTWQRCLAAHAAVWRSVAG